jgi:hypothetical protein
MSICLALGLCNAANLDFKIAGMNLFSITAYSRHTSAVDLFDAVFETITYFAEGGYACFERGSIKPLIYGDMENEEFEDMFARCMRCHEYARCGNLMKFENITENDFEDLLARCIEKASIMKNTCKGTVEKSILSRKLDTVRQWQASFRQTRVQGGLREAPYSIGVFGGTAVGKSSIANILMVTTLKHNGYCASDDRIVTINDSDKYMSNFRSSTNGVLIDDVGNTKEKFVERAPTSLMIQLVNNVRMYANMAEADMKGKVSVEPKVVITTKNVKDTCASVYSNEPASITRRDRITLTCTVKPQYAVHGMLNGDKVRALHPTGVPIVPDFWNIRVEKSFPIVSKVKGGTAAVGWEVVRDGGRPLDNIGLPELIRWVGRDSKTFFASQKELVANSNNLDKQIQLCPRCHFPTPDVCMCSYEDRHTVPRVDCECSPGYCSMCDAWHSEDDSSAGESSGDESSSMMSDPDSVDSSSEESGGYDWDIYDDQVGEYLIAALIPRFRKWENKWTSFSSYWLDNCEQLAVKELLKRLDWLETSRWTKWTNWVPTDWLEHPYAKYLVWHTHSDIIAVRVKRAYANHLCLLGFILYLAAVVHHYFLLLIPLSLFGLAGVIKYEKQKMYDIVVADNSAMPAVFKMYRDRHIKWITGACAIIAALYALAQVYKAFKVTPTPQGNLNPTCMADIEHRDTEVNPWAGVKISPMPCTEKSKTTSPDRLEGMVQANLCHMSLEVKHGEIVRNYECDAFFPKSNVAIIPQHAWKSNDMMATFTRHDPTMIGGNFKCYLYRKNSVDIPDTDLSVVWVPNGGDWKDLTEYFPLQKFADVPARLTYKKKDGSCITSKLMMKVGEITTYAANFFGATYSLQFNTFDGLCIAPLITETKGPLIGGFHLGGKNGEVKGCSGLLLKEQVDSAIEKLHELPNVVLAKSSGTLPKEQYGIQYFESATVHFKSPINFMPEGTNCKYYGQVKGRASYYSDVVPTIISKHVEEVCGVPQKWGPPKFQSNWPWQRSLQYSVKPSCGIEGSLLEKASKDYLQGLYQLLDKLPQIKESIKPLNEMQTVCGIDAMRFIDKMPPNTSVGYPLSGAKSNYLTLLEPEEYPSHQCPAQLDPMFWEEAYKMEELYASGERAYPIFKACLKDEPTPRTKDKVRVFQGAPMCLQLVVRKYYLPIARTLSLFPLVSECAVGINAQGPEWDQLAKHVKQFGEDRILAGDYSKYDLRMPAQVMFAAFRIMMDMAKYSGNYSDRDLTIMEGIATDICYPLMAYNGDLIQHFGSNPSGQNLTVYINSIVNSLLFRSAYFHVTRNRAVVPPFREVCALTTYGDDAKSSVHKDFPEFNHISVAAFLQERDMVFTMPDKESEPTPYMRDEDADFLKRKNVYSEDTGMIMGALTEDSIFKSLHTTLKSSALTKEQQSMQNIDGALREWFNHGREVYEKRRAQMIDVADRAGIKHGCTVIHETYDDRLKAWKDRYS